MKCWIRLAIWGNIFLNQEIDKSVHYSESRSGTSKEHENCQALLAKSLCNTLAAFYVILTMHARDVGCMLYLEISCISTIVTRVTFVTFDKRFKHTYCVKCCSAQTSLQYFSGRSFDVWSRPFGGTSGGIVRRKVLLSLKLCVHWIQIPYEILKRECRPFVEKTTGT